MYDVGNFEFNAVASDTKCHCLPRIVSSCNVFGFKVALLFLKWVQKQGSEFLVKGQKFVLDSLAKYSLVKRICLGNLLRNLINALRPPLFGPLAQFE